MENICRILDAVSFGLTGSFALTSLYNLIFNFLHFHEMMKTSTNTFILLPFCLALSRQKQVIDQDACTNPSTKLIPGTKRIAGSNFKSVLLVVFLFLSLVTFGQPGTSINYTDQYGSLTLTYNGLINSKHSYAAFDGLGTVRVRWTGSRWEIDFTGTMGEYGIFYYNSSATAMNPPALGLGVWVIGTDPTITMPLAAFNGTGTTTTLPIELTSFEANNEGGKVYLSWATASETNNAGFDIEASQNGIRFDKIGFVKGNGTTSTEKGYHFTDESAATGLTYYRLKQIDMDGGFEYSKVVSVLKKSERLNAISISPNPANDILNIVVETKNDDDLEINLSDIFGKTIKLQKITTQQGLHTQSLDLQDVPKGIYFLQLQQGTEKVIRKIIKS